MKLHGYLLQATLPSLPKLLQLPHLTFAQAKAAEDKLRSLRGPGGIETWNRLSNEQRKAVLAGALNDEQLRETAEIARTWPKLEVLGAKFKGQPDRNNCLLCPTPTDASLPSSPLPFQSSARRLFLPRRSCSVCSSSDSARSDPRRPLPPPTEAQRPTSLRHPWPSTMTTATTRTRT